MPSFAFPRRTAAPGAGGRASVYDDGMHFLLLIAILLGLVFGPGMWVKHVLTKYATPADRYRASGAQLAR